MLTTDRPAVDDGRTGEVRVVDGAVWKSVSEIARLKGVSRQGLHKRVQRLVADSGLEVKGTGRRLRVNLAHFDRLVGETEDPAQELRNPSGRAAPAETPDEPGGSSYSVARAQREGYQAENARLDLEERLGQLTRVDEVERRTFDTFRRVRDRLLGLPSRIATKVADAPDARAARMIIDHEIRNALELLAEELDSETEEANLDAA